MKSLEHLDCLISNLELKSKKVRRAFILGRPCKGKLPLLILDTGLNSIEKIDVVEELIISGISVLSPVRGKKIK